ncbi:MAG: ABC transporter permease [Parachlamydiaceae bacterium]|nr:ABC transporter permease [Parachlamydiaceae bacterium]
MTGISAICNNPNSKTLSHNSSYWYRCWQGFKANRLAVIALLVLFIIIFCAIFAPLFSQYTYYEMDLAEANRPPSFAHWCGTDDLGRDVFVRLWYGARISLFIGVAAAVIDLVIGMLWGGAAALAGGKTDEVMMRIADILYSIPSLLIVISLMVVLGPGLHTILIALSILGWITMARVVRGQLLQLKQQGYVMAARGLGAGFWRILFKHMLPNALGPIIVTLTLTIPSAIFMEAFLSYLGLGVQAPIASWGTMANEGLPALEYYPWRLFFPAGLICLTILTFNLIGDGLNDANERLSHR